MKTKGLMTIFAVLLTVSVPVAGQQRSEQVQERLRKFKERLELTPEQVEQVRPVLMEEMEKLKAARDKHSGDQNRRGRLKMARELRSIQDSTDEQLRKILSKKQMDELKKIREETRQQFRERIQ